VGTPWPGRRPTLTDGVVRLRAWETGDAPAALGPAGLRRIYAHVEERNTASVAVAVAAGYRQVAGRLEYVELKGSTRAYREYERVAFDLSDSS
jgi:RimJ/RimL family protein N-acetyltransferase